MQMAGNQSFLPLRSPSNASCKEIEPPIEVLSLFIEKTKIPNFGMSNSTSGRNNHEI